MAEDQDHRLAVAAEVHGHPLVAAAEVQEAGDTADRLLISFNIKAKAWYILPGLCFSAGAETSFLIELPVFFKHIDSSDL